MGFILTCIGNILGFIILIATGCMGGLVLFTMFYCTYVTMFKTTKNDIKCPRSEDGFNTDAAVNKKNELKNSSSCIPGIESFSAYGGNMSEKIGSGVVTLKYDLSMASGDKSKAFFCADWRETVNFSGASTLSAFVNDKEVGAVLGVNVVGVQYCTIDEVTASEKDVIKIC